MTDTPEQIAAVEADGKVIVSASAGSGKTYVMIKKLVAAIKNGADLDEILAVTFTKKAAAQMKEKLSKAIISAIPEADEEGKKHLKTQLSKIPSANISTIHAFCAGLIRRYFYALGQDGSFDIISSDDPASREYSARAVETLFDGYYESANPDFLTLLQCFKKKRSDAALKRLISDCYEDLRVNSDYKKILDKCENLYSEKGFEEVVNALTAEQKSKYISIKHAVEDFRGKFVTTQNREVYEKIFAEMATACELAAASGAFDELPPFYITKKPRDCEADAEAGERFKAFKDGVYKRYRAVRGELLSEEEERRIFLQSGRAATAFCRIMRDYDAEYTAVKRDENKLDYNDLEHLTCELLKDGQIKDEITSHCRYVFVDEYQDVNPVQEEIISGVAEKARLFLVGDVKQAIYGFRGSRSQFFADKYKRFSEGGCALKLSANFRSSGGVVDFINRLFSEVMKDDVYGIDYASTSKMAQGAPYPEGFGGGTLHIFGKNERKTRAQGVYSVAADARKKEHTREGLCVLKIVEEELRGKHYDPSKGGYVDTQAGDICILTRKLKGESVQGIVRALTDAGYAVAGVQSENLCDRPECRNMIDILSYIDNSRQDIPMVCAMLSPLGGFSEDELARIKIAVREVDGNKRPPFYDVCRLYSARGDSLAAKIRAFYKKIKVFCDLSEALSACALIDKICIATGLEARYSAGGGEKLKNIRALAAQGENLTLQAFLARLSASGYNIPAPAPSASDSIKLMTMHASKGLEFPIVIIADICRTFKGADYSELPLDAEFGFAPKFRDPQTMLQYNTVLRRLVKIRTEREELKNEMNLFYVACTRAMSRLHIVAEEVAPYSPEKAAEAKTYADMFDLTHFSPVEEQLGEVIIGSGRNAGVSGADPALADEIDSLFMREYGHYESVNLPVKSSASAIMKLSDGEAYYRPYELFGGEGETGAERGTAYHRFLELCDFSVKDAAGIEAEIKSFVKSGKMSEESATLLDFSELEEILNMPVFSELDGAELYREREFLCRLPANECLNTSSADYVLLQGAIDLLAVTGDGTLIVDYKYSGKDDEKLKETYFAQLALYRKVAARIMGVDIKNVRAVIVNIRTRRQIPLKFT